MIYKYTSKIAFIVMLVCMLVANVQNIIIAYMVQTLTNIATANNFNKIPSFLIEVVLGLFITLVAGLIFNYLKTNLIKKTNVAMRSLIFKGMLQTPADDSELGFLTTDFKLLETNRFDAQLEIISQIFIMVLALGYALAVNWLITCLFLFASLFPMLLSNLFQNKIKQASDLWTKQNGQYVAQSKNFLEGKSTLNLYQAQNEALVKNQKQIIQLENALAKMNRLNLNSSSGIDFVAATITFLLPFMVGIYLVIHGQTSLGSLFAIVQLANSFVNPILLILEDRNKLSTTKKIVAVAKTYIEKAEEKTPKTKLEFKELSVKDLTISRKNQILAQHLNFSLKPGQKIAIIGPSGCGKSTLLTYLLTGENGTGKLKLNQEAVAAGKISDLFAYASQKPIIFKASLKFNLTLGKKIAQKEILAVCENLGLTELIKQKGLDYQVLENTENLSGGQLARIELARAILVKRPILLLDEINASLDQKTATKIHEYLWQSDLTLIEVIHHYQKNDLANYDKVISLK